MAFSLAKVWNFHFYFLYLQHRSYLSTASGLWPSDPKRGLAGGLIYEKDVFERLSLCITNFANSSIPQQTDGNETSTFGTFLYTYIYIVRAGVGYLRCLSCVGRAMRRPVMPGWAKKQTPTPFLYHKLNRKQYV